MAPGDLFLKCSDGHVYTASMQTIRWRSMHIGTTQYRRCPIDNKWRKAVFVNPRELTKDQLDRAAANRV